MTIGRNGYTCRIFSKVVYYYYKVCVKKYTWNILMGYSGEKRCENYTVLNLWFEVQLVTNTTTIS